MRVRVRFDMFPSLFGIFLLIGSSSFAETLDVPNEYPTIQQALDAASAGDSVRVSPGRYVEARLDFKGKPLVLLSTNPLDSLIVAATVIDGNRRGSVLQFDSDDTQLPEVNGLTITGGGGPIIFGGGIYSWGGRPQIKNCRITKNDAGGGGGIFIRYAPESALIDHCTIFENTAGSGGGLYLQESEVQVKDCIISSNEVEAFVGGDAGAMATYYGTVEMTRCRLNNNTSAYEGGAVWTHLTTLTFNQCEIRGNFALRGAGIFSNWCQDLILTTTTITDNEATELGGGIYWDGYHGSITNSIVARNAAPTGAGLWLSSRLPLSIENCTITDNLAAQGGGMFGGGDVSVRNTILWNNGPDQIVNFPGLGTVTYSDVEGGFVGTGNIDADPTFIRYHGFDQLLKPDSPCVDAGDPSIEDEISDWHPQWPQRYPNGSQSDMGAYGGSNRGWLTLR